MVFSDLKRFIVDFQLSTDLHVTSKQFAELFVGVWYTQNRIIHEDSEFLLRDSGIVQVLRLLPHIPKEELKISPDIPKLVLQNNALKNQDCPNNSRTTVNPYITRETFLSNAPSGVEKNSTFIGLDEDMDSIIPAESEVSCSEYTDQSIISVDPIAAFEDFSAPLKVEIDLAIFMELLGHIALLAFPTSNSWDGQDLHRLWELTPVDIEKLKSNVRRENSNIQVLLTIRRASIS